MIESATTRRGRPPKPAAQKKRNNVTIRMRDALKAQLEESAARNQRSLSEEIEAQLERLAEQERDAGGRDMMLLTKLMGAAFQLAGERAARAAGKEPGPPNSWVDDARIYSKAAAGVFAVLCLQTPGVLTDSEGPNLLPETGRSGEKFADLVIVGAEALKRLFRSPEQIEDLLGPSYRNSVRDLPKDWKFFIISPREDEE